MGGGKGRKGSKGKQPQVSFPWAQLKQLSPLANDRSGLERPYWFRLVRVRERCAVFPQRREPQDPENV